MADASLAEIEHLLVGKAIKTLGSMTCPLGSSAAAVDRMKTLGQEWVDKVLSSSLSRRKESIFGEGGNAQKLGL